MTTNYAIPLPPVNEWGTPLAKMPNCPHCGEDELGLLEPDRATCYGCSAVVTRRDESTPITSVPAICNHCPWIGSVGACEPADDGELLCPQCLNLIVVRMAHA